MTISNEVDVSPKVFGLTTPSSRINIEDVIDAIGEKIIVIDMDTSKLIWSTEQFKRCFPGFDASTRLSDLENCFEGLLSHISEWQTGSLPETGTPKQVTVKQKHKKRFAVKLANLSTNQIVIRFEDIASHDRLLQRHLEDREKLLFTSRAISVSEMATTLAHELNQPIGAVSNLLSGISMRLRRGDEVSSKIFDALDSANDQAIFASKIIGRIRDYTQSFQPQPTEVDLGKLVNASIALLDWEIRREEVQVTQTAQDEKLFLAQGDEVMLQQVFINLLRNAIDAMRSEKNKTRRIDVNIQRVDDQVEVSIADTGCGLSSDAEKNLFVPFVSTKPTGMGVGLNICRSFIEMHQGKLWMTNNQESGCTFHISLPALV